MNRAAVASVLVLIALLSVRAGFAQAPPANEVTPTQPLSNACPDICTKAMSGTLLLPDQKVLLQQCVANNACTPAYMLGGQSPCPKNDDNYEIQY
jgi:hypothetical protein